VGETDMDINNYNVLLENTSTIGKIQIKCTGARGGNDSFPKRRLGKGSSREWY
jgi:hypothetical protein